MSRWVHLLSAREWTDWAPPGTPSEPTNGHPPLLFDASGLLALAELVQFAERTAK